MPADPHHEPLIDRATARRTGGKLAVHFAVSAALGLAVAGALSLLYALAPEPQLPWDLWQFVVFGVLCVAAYIGLTVTAVMVLARTGRPLMMGLVFVVLLATVLILSYSWLYLSMSSVNPDYFTQPLSKASAVYFTVTILSTVGFGDITATNDTSRLIVTSQMLVGFTIITLAVRTVVSSTSTAVKVKHHRELDELKRRAGLDSDDPTAAPAPDQDAGNSTASPGT